MTNDQLQSIRDDLAYMKALAEEGRRAPLLGGAILVAAGVIFAPTSVVHWAIEADVLEVGRQALLPLWLGAVAIFLVALFVLKTRLANRPGANAIANKVSGAAWGGLGGASFAIGVSLFIAAWKTENTLFLALFPPVILALYGVAWAVAAAVSDRKWMTGVSLGGFAASILSAWFVGEAAQWLVYTAALLLLTAAPGLALMREEPSEVV
jgi:hypothetical protein